MCTREIKPPTGKSPAYQRVRWLNFRTMIRVAACQQQLNWKVWLTKFLQVVHGVHVVNSLAIEVEPGGSKVSVSGIQEKGNLVGSPGIFDNGCFWETCRPTGVDVKNLHAGFICSGWERAICTWALIIMRMKKTTMIQTMTLSLKLSLLLTDSGTSVDGWFGNSWSRLTAWVSRWECSGGSSLTLFQSPIPDAPSGRWDTWWERMLSLLCGWSPASHLPEYISLTSLASSAWMSLTAEVSSPPKMIAVANAECMLHTIMIFLIVMLDAIVINMTNVRLYSAIYNCICNEMGSNLQNKVSVQSWRNRSKCRAAPFTCEEGTVLAGYSWSRRERRRS